MKKLFDFEGWEVFSEQDDVEYMRDSGLVDTEFFWCKDPRYPHIDRIACFRLAPFPMNCGIVVSIQTTIDASMRGLHLSGRLHKIKEKVARDFGYTMMLCTVESTNMPQIVGASRQGWRFGNKFDNKRFSTVNLLGVKKL